MVAPLLNQNQVTEVDYGTFMDMIDQSDIGLVQVEDSQIIFTNKDETKVYTTGPMDDPTLTERLHNCGAKFDRVVEQPASPLMSFLLTFILPHTNFRGTGPVHEQKDDGTGGQTTFLRPGQEQRQDLRSINQRHTL
ncbi:MAG: ATP-dependent metallopeptidase FtsH/Yme1/Tma family protein [Oscillospiraceae bacterium]